MEPAVARHLGARLLAEIEEESLEELLKTIRTRLRAETLPAPNNDDASSTSRPLTTATSNTHLPTTAKSAPIIAPQPHIPFPLLKTIIARHQKGTQSAPPPVLAVSGRYLPFIYHLVSTLISTPAAPHRDNEGSSEFHGNQHCGYTVVIVDAECRFDVTRLVSDTSPSGPDTKTNPNPAAASSKLEEKQPHEDVDIQQPRSQPRPSCPATPSDLRHVYIYRPAHSQVRAAIAAASDFMLYGTHQSRDREWWGTIVVGSSGLSSSSSSSAPASASKTSTSRTASVTTPADVLTGYKGWLRVDRAEIVPGFHLGISAEEALADRDRRAEVVGKAEGRWRATSRWGSYAFGS